MRKNNPAGLRSLSQGGISMSFESNKGKSDLVKDAERILDRYVRRVP